MLAGWPFRKEITVTNASADFSSFILVGKTSAAVGEDVDCDGLCLDNFHDLRFTELDGVTLIPHWRESVVNSNGTKLASIAFKNNSDPETTLFMYFGKLDAPDVSSIANTFIKGDDFERGNDGDEVGGDWTEVQGDVEISTTQKYGGTRSMKLNVNGNLPMCTIPVTASDNIAIRHRLYKEDAARSYIQHGDGTYYIQLSYFQDEDIEYYDTAWRDTGTNITPDQWELVEYNDFVWGTPNFDIWHNDAEIQANAGMVTSALYTDVVKYIGETADSWIDDFIVMKWVATPPTFAFGPIESCIPRHGFVNFQDPGIV